MQDSFAQIEPAAAAGGRMQNLVGMTARVLGAVISVLLVVAIGYWAFKLGQRDASQLPVIQAQEGEARIRPENPGGEEIANQGLAVNEVLARSEPAAVETEAALAPEPETIPPAPQPAAAVEVVSATPISDQPTLSEISAAAREAAQPVTEAVEETVAEVAAVVEEVQPVIENPVASADALLDELVASVLSEAPPEAPVVDMQRPARREAAQIASAASEPTANSAPTASAPEAQPASATATGIVETSVPLSLVETGDRLIQLGIFGNEEEAQAEWDRLRTAHADLLGDKELFIERREAGTRVFYRLRVLPFENLDDARGVCTALVNRDEQCIAVTAR